MPEVRIPVDTYMARYMCDECDGGEMKGDGIVLTSNPPQYPHTCTDCGARKIFMSSYPHQVTVQQEEGILTQCAGCPTFVLAPGFREEHGKLICAECAIKQEKADEGQACC